MNDNELLRLAVNSFRQACAAYVYSVMVDTGNYFPNKRPLFFRELQKIMDERTES